MNLKDLIFGGGVKSGDDGGIYRDSIQAWLPIKNIIGGVVITKDGRFVKILELLPVNIYLKSPNDRQNIISSFAAYLKIAPNDLQMVARTLPADTQAYVEQMQRYAEKEDNEACREMIEDNIQEIGNGIASDAMRHRFFLVFQYEASMRAKRNTVHKNNNIQQMSKNFFITILIFLIADLSYANIIASVRVNGIVHTSARKRKGAIIVIIVVRISIREIDRGIRICHINKRTMNDHKMARRRGVPSGNSFYVDDNRTSKSQAICDVVIQICFRLVRCFDVGN